MQPTQSKTAPARRAYDFEEFANIFGRSRDWTYRLQKAGKVRAITGYGKMMIPASEVDRIAEGGEARAK